jgi:hypothetical protein
MTNKYTSKGNFYSVNSTTVTIKPGEKEIALLVVKPKLASKNYWFTVEHMGTGEYTMPSYVYILLGICGFCCCICCVIGFSVFSAKVKRMRLADARKRYRMNQFQMNTSEALQHNQSSNQVLPKGVDY